MPAWTNMLVRNVFGCKLCRMLEGPWVSHNQWMPMAIFLNSWTRQWPGQLGRSTVQVLTHSVTSSVLQEEHIPGPYRRRFGGHLLSGAITKGSYLTTLFAHTSPLSSLYTLWEVSLALTWTMINFPNSFSTEPNTWTRDSSNIRTQEGWWLFLFSSLSAEGSPPLHGQR